MCNAPAPTGIYTLSLHDALPILNEVWMVTRSCLREKFTIFSAVPLCPRQRRRTLAAPPTTCALVTTTPSRVMKNPLRSEEHTSELQSHSDLVCRLLLEKKKRNQ